MIGSTYVLQRAGSALALILVLAGCQTVPNAEQRIFLAGTDWTLLEYGTGEHGNGLVEVPLNTYTMRLEDDGSARFRLDCNRGNGSWQAAGSLQSGSLSFGPVATTRAYCGDEAIDQELVTDLQRVTSYSQYDGRLTMTLTDSETIYVWDRID